MKITSGVIIGLIVSLIMLQVLVGISEDIIPSAAGSYENLSNTLAADTQVLGTDAAAFAGDTDDYMGWFWVLGPFVLVLTVILGVFRGRR